MTKIILPEYWNCDDSHIIAKLSTEGTAINLDDAVKKYAGELDFSPRAVDSKFDMYLGGIYMPERFCSLQAVQEHGHGKKYTTLTLVGIKESCIENAVEFAEACEFEAKKEPKPQKGREGLLRLLYDKMFQMMGKEKALESLAEALKDSITDVWDIGTQYQSLN